MEMYHFVFILIAAVNGSPADTRRRPNVGLTLVHRLRRWPNVNPTLGVNLLFVVLRARTLPAFTTVYSRPVGVGFLVSVSVADSRTWGRLGVGWGAGQGPGWVRGGPGRGGGCRHCGRHTATSVAVPRGIFPRRTPACDHFGTILPLTETLIRLRNNFLFNDFPPILDAKQDFKIYFLFDHGMFELVYKHEF